METLVDMYSRHHVYDICLIPFTDDNEIYDLIKCLKNEKKPITDLEILWNMKFTKKFNKEEILRIMMNNTVPCSLLMFSLLCNKEDKHLYRNRFFNHKIICNNIDGQNYMKAKIIVHDILQSKTKIKTELLEAKNYLDKIDNSYLISVPYYKYIVKYFLANYDSALKYLIIFFKSIKYYDLNHIEIFYDKFNLIQLYNELNKLENKDIFKPLFDKLNNDKTIKYIQMKMNKFKDKNNPCCKCNNTSVSFDFYNCNHLYCIECITEKHCVLCKTKHVY